MYVIVAGGGKVGYYLAQTLQSANHEVLVIEKDYQRYRWLQDHLGECVLYGDATEAGTLQRAGAARADVVTAVTGHDEDNIVICRLAGDLFGCSRVVARVNNPKNEEAFRLFGIHNLVNGTQLIYHLVEEELGLMGLFPLLTFRGGVQFLEAILPPDAPAVGAAIKDLVLPDRCLLLAILRGEEVIFPRGEVVLRPGDHVFAMVDENMLAPLRDALLGQRNPSQHP